MTGDDWSIPDWLSVSRETHDRLQVFYRLVCKWNAAINLVSAASLQDGWHRHVLDSAQLLALSDCDHGLWLDVGSGAGFPGLVVSIMAGQDRPGLHVTLVESDRRKATFLSEAIRQLGLNANVYAGRLETFTVVNAAVVSARAFAPLDKVLAVAERHLSQDGTALFMKGQAYQSEMTVANHNWRYDCDVVPSKTDANSVILKVKKVRHA